MMAQASSCAPSLEPMSLSRQLNRDCLCLTLNSEALYLALEQESDDPQFCRTFINARPHLFSSTPFFISEGEIARMQRVVRAIERAAQLPAYQEAVLAWAPPIARHDPGPLGVFMGFDFHLGETGPKLIEVNTNAGGAFLNALLAKAQYVCCREFELALSRSNAQAFETTVARMFANEWRLQRPSGELRRIAIVDDDPQSQYLYPEFLLAQRLLIRHGVEAVVADARDLRYEQGQLTFNGQPVDLVYNRLVDFSLEAPEHEALRRAYLEGAAVVTPNPHVHALFADKRNLTMLCDRGLLASWGLAPEDIEALQAIPRTERITMENAPRLWTERKRMFFKPAGGHGSKAVYRGDKLTKRVWDEILQSEYVAQEFVAPAERMIQVDGPAVSQKADVRLYTYNGEILLSAARLYQGQTTNFRTPGGGFSPVIALSS